jgi:hypothetical protein
MKEVVLDDCGNELWEWLEKGFKEVVRDDDPLRNPLGYHFNREKGCRGLFWKLHLPPTPTILQTYICSHCEDEIVFPLSVSNYRQLRQYFADKLQRAIRSQSG